jgi:hypothetical protein
MVHKQELEIIIRKIIAGFDKAMVRNKTFCVGVDDKYGLFKGVEQDTVGRLRAEAVDGKEPFTKV